ncbi:MAG: histidine kinase [Ignavibacteriae bacterium]|nr:histidine kinase [Ignavibacteriota bacterium]
MRTIPWKPIIAAWTAYGLFMSTQSYVVSLRAGRPVTIAYALVNDMTYASCWALLTPLILLLARRYPLGNLTLLRNFLIHLGFSFALALSQKFVHGLLISSYRLIVEGVAFSWDFQVRNLIAYFDYGIPLYWIVLLLNYGYDYYSRYQERAVRAAQLETQLAQAQLNALKMQLHPHFLFNTLNAISVLIQKDPELAKKTVGRLSELLRYTLDNVGSQQVTLREELAFLERYLQIEQTRFGDRLTVRFEVDEEIKDATVPTMILQPLVENAIKHGIAKRRGDARIEVSANRDNGSLQLRVKDNGVGLASESEVKDGVGLSMTRARLRELYGSQQSFSLNALPEGGTEAIVMMPYMVGGEN